MARILLGDPGHLDLELSPPLPVFTSRAHFPHCGIKGSVMSEVPLALTMCNLINEVLLYLKDAFAGVLQKIGISLI